MLIDPLIGKTQKGLSVEDQSSDLTASLNNLSGQIFSSQGSDIPSSMETAPADFVDLDAVNQESQDEDCWGRLFPVGSSFSSIDLSKNEYTFGRGDNCDYEFNSEAIQKHPCFLAYSKLHFKIVRTETSSGFHVFIHDMSSNGTFVNAEKVGRSNKQVLVNNDEISLAMKNNRAFIFVDLKAKEELTYPGEITQHYTVSKVLGRGACGEVRLVFEKGSCQPFAMKIISKKKFSIGGSQQVQTNAQVMGEVLIMKNLHHPCIIAIENVIDTPDTLYIILELVEGGELFDRIISVGQFSESISKVIFYQMCLAIKYLHDQGITHRDLKPENILLTKPNDNMTLVKVTDFGLSKFVDAHTMMKTFCGTPNYLAPEVLKTAGAAAYTSAIDAWSLGIILFICLVGYPPFSDERGDMELPRQILEGHYDLPEKYWSGISDEAKDLVRKLMTVDVSKRLTLEEALNHPWFQDDEMKSRVEELMKSARPAENGLMPSPKKPIAPQKRKLETVEEEQSRKRTSVS